VLRLNRYFNRLRQNFTSGADAAAFVTYVPDIPFIGYRKYKQPLQYTFKGTAVRALAVKNINGERIIGPVVSKTYFVGSRHQTQLPIIAVYIPEKSLFDYDEGILVAGVDYDEWLSSDEASEKVGVFSYPANWKRRENNRAAAQFEVLPATGASSKLFETELRSHGNTSRAFANKSLRLYPKSTVDFPIFTGQPPTEKLRINLRLERRARLYDDVAHAVLHGLAFASQRSEPYLVFINGEFYSILNARDRRDATFLREFYNLKNKKVDFLSFEPNRNEDSDGRNRSAKKGDFAAWDDLIAQTYENQSLSLEAIQEFIDIESLSDYYIVEIYSANKDWPGNNNSCWRFADEKNKTESGASDGRWRWYLYDLDEAFQEPQLNVLERIIRPSHANNPDYPAYILNRLLKDGSFEQYFITRFLDLINTTFVPQRVISLIDAAEASLEVDIPWQIQRWNTPRSVAVWKDSIQTMRDFALKRAEIQRQQLRDFFELAEPYRVTVDVALKNGAGIELAQAPGSIKLNTLTLGVSDSELALPVAASHKPKAITPYLSLPWSGQYFQAMPLEIAAEARPGYRFAYWQGTVPDALRLQPIITLSPTNDVRLTAVFEKDE